MPYMSIHGTRLYYEETGTPGGRPLVLLHAALQTSESTLPLRQLVSPLGLAVVSPDQRGHGRSANPGRTFSIPQLADDIEALLDRLDIARPVMAGYSLGGIVGIELARRGRLSALVTLASRIHTAPKARQAFDPADIRRRSPLWAKQLAERHVEIPWEELAAELGALLEAWPGFTDGDLASIPCPTLVVQGDRDHMVPVGQARRLAATVPGARLVIAPSAGHPDLLYRRDAMAAVYDFLQGLS
jgi:pimeloyl-ACP methyl ester carboxylesterase